MNDLRTVAKATGNAPRKKKKERHRGSERKEAKTMPAEEYQLPEKERAVVERWLEQHRNAPPAVNVNVGTNQKRTSVTYNHPNQLVARVLLADALATADPQFSSTLLHQIAEVSRCGNAITEPELNSFLSIVRNIAPRDPIESLLAAQMAAVHNATMVAAGRLNHVECIEQLDANSNSFNKLARTFVAQVEALKRYRSAGEQTITVQHVSVSDVERRAILTPFWG